MYYLLSFIGGIIFIITIINIISYSNSSKSSPDPLYNDITLQIQKLNLEKQKLEKNKLFYENELEQKRKFIEKQAKELLSDKEKFQNDLDNKYHSLLIDLKNKEQFLLQDKAKSQKWLSGMIADFLTITLDNDIKELENSHSITKHEKATKITDLKAQIKFLTEHNKELEYELKYLFSLYPNLEDIIDSDLETNIFPENYLENTGWLSKDEWENLSSIEKNTLAYERYKKRRKTKAQIGRDFELYIGWKYENLGYKVTYNGINNGFNDEGIDLIAKKDKETIIIQCKYWSKNKIIHEKHICQLFGTSIKYQLLHPDELVYAAFYCHNALSENAHIFADKLSISIYENIELKDYPAIKCCDSSMIYHLPFDLNYDKIVNCHKVMTVKEAEDSGFRRAFKWHPYSSN